MTVGIFHINELLHEFYYFAKYETKIINYALALSGLRVCDNMFICVRNIF